MALVPTDYEHDWLYGRVTKVCDESLEYDYSPSDPIPRIQMACLWALCIVIILFAMQRQEHEALPMEATKSAAKGADDLLLSSPSPSGGRWVFLDIVRIAAVTCVVTEHGGGDDYSRRNVLFSAQWTLPSLFLTSGVAFMFSRSGPLSFLLRLAAVFCIGCGFNALADGAFNERPGWQCDLGNTIFQMFYVVVIGALSAAMMPMRQVLREHDDSVGSRQLGGLVPTRVLYAVLYVSVWLAWVVIYLGYAKQWIEWLGEAEGTTDSSPDATQAAMRRLGAWSDEQSHEPSNEPPVASIPHTAAQARLTDLLTERLTERLAHTRKALTDPSEWAGLALLHQNASEPASVEPAVAPPLNASEPAADLCHPVGTGAYESAGDAGQTWGRGHATTLAELPFMAAHVCGFPALVCLHALLRRKADGMLTWVLLLYIYLPCVFFPLKEVHTRGPVEDPRAPP